MWAQNNKWKISLQNHFHGKPLNIFTKDLELFLLQNECFLNAYLICLRFTRKHHKRIVQSGGAAPDGKIPLPLMTKGEIFIRCRWFQDRGG
jgi:hypothetical protein